MRIIRTDSDERKDEHDAVQLDSEQFLAPILPMLAYWQSHLEQLGIALEPRLLIGPYPFNAPQNPVKAGLMVSIKGPPAESWGGFIYALEGYIPDHSEWLAAEIDFDLEEHLVDPKF